MNDPQQQITTANAYASAVEAFIRDHPMVSAIIVATLVSWTLTAALKPWITHSPMRPRILRTFDCFIAGIVAYIMLYGQFDWRWRGGLALLVASASPFAYFALSEALCWKLPGLRKYLSLRELTTETDSPTETP